MAKSSSPVRLQDDLMQAATIAGSRFHRSAAEQVEHWASLGRQINRFIDTDTLLKVSMGLVRLKVEPTVGQPVDPEAVFAAVETDRATGELSKKITSSAVRYHASAAHPGYLEQVDEKGNRIVGSFKNGTFTPLNKGK